MIQKVLVLLFSLLAVAFFARFVQYAYKWLSHASASPEVNYKALTAWCAVYILVCAGIAWAISKYPKNGDTEAA